MNLTPKWLGKEQFLKVLDLAPLVSIDLIIKDNHNRVLLGKRVNEPAKGMWFVPGGRIMKDESIEDAFERVSLTETGKGFRLSDARLLGPFTHYYETNVFNEPGITTQYIAIAYILDLSGKLQLPDNQHTDYEWVGPDVLRQPGHQRSAGFIKPEEIHENTLVYLRTIFGK